MPLAGACSGSATQILEVLTRLSDTVDLIEGAAHRLATVTLVSTATADHDEAGDKRALTATDATNEAVLAVAVSIIGLKEAQLARDLLLIGGSILGGTEIHGVGGNGSHNSKRHLQVNEDQIQPEASIRGNSSSNSFELSFSRESTYTKRIIRHVQDLSVNDGGVAGRRGLGGAARIATGDDVDTKVKSEVERVPVLVLAVQSVGLVAKLLLCCGRDTTGVGTEVLDPTGELLIDLCVGFVEINHVVKTKKDTSNGGAELQSTVPPNGLAVLVETVRTIGSVGELKGEGVGGGVVAVVLTSEEVLVAVVGGGPKLLPQVSVGLGGEGIAARVGNELHGGWRGRYRMEE